MTHFLFITSPCPSPLLLCRRYPEELREAQEANRAALAAKLLAANPVAASTRAAATLGSHAPQLAGDGAESPALETPLPLSGDQGVQSWPHGILGPMAGIG